MQDYLSRDDKRGTALAGIPGLVRTGTAWRTQVGGLVHLVSDVFDLDGTRYWLCTSCTQVGGPGPEAQIRQAAQAHATACSAIQV